MADEKEQDRVPGESEPVTVRLPRHIVAALEDFRSRKSIPTRPEVVQIIIEDWLISHGMLPLPRDDD